MKVETKIQILIRRVTTLHGILEKMYHYFWEVIFLNVFRLYIALLLAASVLNAALK